MALLVYGKLDILNRPSSSAYVSWIYMDSSKEVNNTYADVGNESSAETIVPDTLKLLDGIALGILLVNKTESIGERLRDIKCK